MEPAPPLVPDLDLEVHLTGLCDRHRAAGVGIALPLFLLVLAGLYFSGMSVPRGIRGPRTDRITLVNLQDSLEEVGRPLDEVARGNSGIGRQDEEPRSGDSSEPMLSGSTPVFTQDSLLAPLSRQGTPAAADLPLPGGIDPTGLPRTAAGKLGGSGTGTSVGSRGAAARDLLAEGEIQTIHMEPASFAYVGKDKRPVESYYRVRVLVDANGVPLSATPLNGDKVFFPSLVEAAMKWRFRVPDRLKAEAPHSVVISFRGLHY